MKSKKFMILFFLCMISLFVVSNPVISQDNIGTVYILSDGSISSSTNATVPIQQNGNVYTLTDNLVVNSFVIQRGGITIDGAGYKIEGDGEIGIDLTTINQVTINNVQVNGFYWGIYLQQSAGNNITGNTMQRCGRGLVMINCTQNTIANNVINDNDVGVELVYASDNVFRDNEMDNMNNIAIYGIELSHFINDMDDSNKIGENKKVYYLIDEEDLVINSESYSDAGFIALVRCSNIIVENIELVNNGQGILLAATSDSTITQNILQNDYTGIMLFASSNNIISGNIITNCFRGIQLSKSSSANSISANTITNNTGAMFLFDSPLNTIAANNISENNYGIGFDSSSNNLIRSNYFIDNILQIYDASVDNSTITVSMNTWHVSYPVGGNYWSDYKGIDVKNGNEQDQDGRDNVGDTPYIINNYNQDSFPLIPENALYVYITSPENKSYNADSLTIIYTVSDNEATISYSLDAQTNKTITENPKISNLSDGPHKLTIFAQDNKGNEASHTVHFIISEEGETPIDQETDSFLIILIAGIVIIIVGLVILYFLKFKKK
ncbi:right-handed parallel beta-helix repeat-containing protein [Candidatus Bathyarchaeota archaeon]|nr:right-handed parallel beta-helix repeat-containing protein [Candidatus Bathyarchaeota archaeon]